MQGARNATRWSPSLTGLPEAHSAKGGQEQDVKGVRTQEGEVVLGHEVPPVLLGPEGPTSHPHPRPRLPGARSTDRSCLTNSETDPGAPELGPTSGSTTPSPSPACPLYADPSSAVPGLSENGFLPGHLPTPLSSCKTQQAERLLPPPQVQQGPPAPSLHPSRQCSLVTSSLGAHEHS